MHNEFVRHHNGGRQSCSVLGFGARDVALVALHKAGLHHRHRHDERAVLEQTGNGVFILVQNLWAVPYQAAARQISGPTVQNWNHLALRAVIPHPVSA